MRNILVDIGNTSIGVYCLNNKGLPFTFKCFDSKDLDTCFKALFGDLGGEEGQIYISSVNSEKTKLVKNIVAYKDNLSLRILHNDDIASKVTELGYTIPNLHILGSDLLYDILGLAPSTLLADYGTASKILALDKDRVFLGGMIGPGLNIINRSLFKSTELLGDYVVEMPPDYLSYDTKDAINASTVFGEGMKLIEAYRKCKADLKDDNLRLVITGGDGKILARALKKLSFEDFILDEMVIYKGMAKALDLSDELFKEKEGN